MESPTVAMVNKSATAKKAATKPAAKSASTEDLIVYTVKELEGLEKEAALGLVNELIEGSSYNNFKLGGVLSRIQEEGWWEGGSYETFRDFTENVYGIKYRKAMYLIEIYNALVESGVPWDSVKEMGWTKLREVAGLLTKENMDEWAERAKSMSTIQLIEYVKQYKADQAGKKESSDEGEDVKTVSTMTFKVHADQKETIRHALDKAREDNKTEFDAVALEYICMQYLEGGLGKQKTVTKKVKQTLTEVMSGSTPEAVLEAFEKQFPDFDVTIAEKEAES